MTPSRYECAKYAGTVTSMFEVLFTLLSYLSEVDSYICYSKQIANSNGSV